MFSKGLAAILQWIENHQRMFYVIVVVLHCLHSAAALTIFVVDCVINLPDALIEAPLFALTFANLFSTLAFYPMERILNANHNVEKKDPNSDGGANRGKEEDKDGGEEINEV